jgi:glycosyltransferase involved in cell wall biosynthesis
MPKDFGGIERYLIFVTSSMAERGHPVHVTAPSKSPLSQRLTAPKTSIRLWHKYDPIAAAKTLRLCRARQFDLAVTHFSPDYIGPAWATKLAGIPTVMTRHVTVKFKPSRARLYQKLYTGFIAISGAVKDHLIQDGIPESQINLVYNGSPPLVPTLSRAESQAHFSISSPAVGVFGRLVWVKGQSVAIEAIRDLPGVNLHLFGDGPQRPELELLTQSLNLTDRVHFHGHIDDVANAMNAVDVVVIPSIWREAFGYTVVEAMSLAKPIVANQYGGIAEILTHNSNALTVTSSNPESPDPAQFATLIRQLLQNQELAHKLGHQAQLEYHHRFTVDHMVEGLERAYARYSSRL